MQLISFYTPENIRKTEVFWCFQEVLRDTSSAKYNIFFEKDTIRLVERFSWKAKKNLYSKVLILNKSRVEFLDAPEMYLNPLTSGYIITAKIDFVRFWSLTYLW